MAAPRRVPKLTYKTPLPSDQTSLSSATTSSADTHPTQSSLDDSLADSISPAASSPVRPAFERSITSTTLASDVSASSSKAASHKKKKPNSVLGFLTLKEPSQNALEQFAEQQRRQAAEKGGKPNAGFLVGVSTQKLPPSVPKVNSKWDGVPEAVKGKDSVISKRGSVASRTPSRSSNSSQNPPNSPSSSSSSAANVPRHFFITSSAFDATGRRDSGPSVVTAGPSKGTLSSPSMSSLPEMTYFFPDDLSASGALPPSTPAPNIPSTSAAPPVFASGSDIPPLSPSLSTSDDTSTFDTWAMFKRLSDTQGFLAGEAQELKLTSDDAESVDEALAVNCIVSPVVVEEVIASAESSNNGPSSTLNVTPKLGAMNFSRPLSFQMIQPIPDPSRSSVSSKYGRSALPTLYEASITSNNNTITDSPTTSHPRESTDASSIAPSIATSVTPSEMSASWYQSSRERLGLGGRIRKSDVLPWESREEELAPGKRKKKHLSVFSSKSAN
ncbi:hypothetical protein P154DRAFT_523234 [Amniculicola lignicola CBS 123094]|uniref:Uncharacterized protein n=1 Tax=Amniculicola lignicola CBS 123094 TaxID=1392246 RepID=A0A6A5WD93_9PLEO|nr:hypothetical protein P154DRAFT_523234 [Amniculicola lignicola CBS 123094]